jgi:hypothetical protein
VVEGLTVERAGELFAGLLPGLLPAIHRELRDLLGEA